MDRKYTVMCIVSEEEALVIIGALLEVEPKDEAIHKVLNKMALINPQLLDRI